MSFQLHLFANSQSGTFRQSPSIKKVRSNYTHATPHGSQESIAYNAYYGKIGFHPLVAFGGITGDFLKAKLLLGNVYTPNEVIEFIQLLIKH